MADDNFPEHSEMSTPDTVNDVIILSGQSNMSGRGGIHTKHHKDGRSYKVWDHIVPPECEAERGTVLCLNAKLQWGKACEPLHHDIDTGKVCGLGPGLVFAASVLQHYKAAGEEPAPVIGLVPCAAGGTQIKEWEKGSRLYEQMIKRAKAAISKSGTLKALLWYQGESDTLSSDNVKEFPQRLEALITNVRSDLQNSELPIIQVGITAANHPFPEFLEDIRRAQMAVNLPGVYYVDAKGLPLLEDNIHLNTHAQVQLGKMLAEVYMERVENPATSLDKDS